MPNTPSYLAPVNRLACWLPQTAVAPRPAQRRAAVAGHEAGGVQARLRVEPALVEQHADQRLHAGDEHPAFGEQEFVVERHFSVPHRNFYPFRPPARVRKII
jgi:hypothetical protein